MNDPEIELDEIKQERSEIKNELKWISLMFSTVTCLGVGFGIGILVFRTPRLIGGVVLTKEDAMSAEETATERIEKKLDRIETALYGTDNPHGGFVPAIFGIGRQGHGTRRQD